MTAFRTIEQSDPTIPADGLRFLTVKSAALGARADITLYVPEAAETASNVPIVMLLHGVYGSHWAWALKGAAHVSLERLIAAGSVPPMVLAMPSDGLWGDGSGYVAHETQDFERWIAEEVPAAVAQAVPVCGAGSPLAVIGLSMGGFAALRLAGKYPTRFAAVAAHSAITEAEDLDPLIEETRAGWSIAPADVNVLAALASAPAPLPPISIDCGRADALLDANRRLTAALRTRGIVHDYAEYAGGHDWAYWRRHVADSLAFVGAHTGRAGGVVTE